VHRRLRLAHSVSFDAEPQKARQQSLLFLTQQRQHRISLLFGNGVDELFGNLLAQVLFGRYSPLGTDEPQPPSGWRP